MKSQSCRDIADKKSEEYPHPSCNMLVRVINFILYQIYGMKNLIKHNA
jgi:hypothetical protein